MKPSRIFIIRHGQSQGNVDRILYRTIPDYAIQLTPLGRIQAFEAGNKIKDIIGNESVKFYVSPFWRTRQTFQEIFKSFPLLTKNDDTFYEDPRLREQEWSGKLCQNEFIHEVEAERDAYGHFYYRFEGGESCADIFDRISGFLNTLHREFEKENFPENCVIVTHGMTLRVLLMRFFHMSIEKFETLKNPDNAQFVILKLCNNKYKLELGLTKFKNIKHPYQFKWE